MMRLLRTAVLLSVYVCFALAITLLAGVTLFGIPAADVWPIAVLFGQVGGSTALLVLLVMQPVVLGRLGGVRGQLVTTGLVGSLSLLGMLLAAAQAMFISGHDLTLLLAMLLYAALLAVGLSLLWVVPLARRIKQLRVATAHVAQGDLAAMVAVNGRDEIALLGDDFNRMATALRQAAAHENELEQSRRDLIAAISHDLRTPLAATHALVEALADGVVTDPDTTQRYLRSAQQEIGHLSQLVDDLFELAQIDAGVLRVNLERASLHDLLSDTLGSFQPQAIARGVRLVGEVLGDIDPVMMSPPKLQRVLHNLLSNALRHTPRAGTIAIRATAQPQCVEVEIADTGEGIPAADLPHIFERSFRGERSRTRRSTEHTPGAGLGLTIAQGLIEAHGSTIIVWSEPGQGAHFRFTLQRP